MIIYAGNINYKITLPKQNRWEIYLFEFVYEMSNLVPNRAKDDRCACRDEAYSHILEMGTESMNAYLLNLGGGFGWDVLLIITLC